MTIDHENRFQKTMYMYTPIEKGPGYGTPELSNGVHLPPIHHLRTNYTFFVHQTAMMEIK